MESCCEMDTCCETSYTRNFWTTDEKIKALKEYKENLDMESRAVSEKILELENKHN